MISVPFDAAPFACHGQLGQSLEGVTLMVFVQRPTITKVLAKGDIHFAGESYDSLAMPLPDIAEFSGYHRVSSTISALLNSASLLASLNFFE